MHKRRMGSRRFLLALAAILITAVPLAAQSTAPNPPVRAPRASDTWLEHYGQTVAGETAVLRAAGLAADWNHMRPLVAHHLQQQSYSLGSPETHAIQRAYHVDTTTNFLVRVGYRPQHLAHPAQARTLVRAANISSWHDADALVLLSPVVFVAELVRIDRKPDNSADLVYRVREPIKSAPRIGTEFRHPLNGPFPTVIAKAGDPPPPPPNPAAWELSSQKAVLFFGSASNAIGNYFGPMPLDGERVLPAYHSLTQETTLASIRAAARAQLCSPGYLAVVRSVDLPHRC